MHEKNISFVNEINTRKNFYQKGNPKDSSYRITEKQKDQ